MKPHLSHRGNCPGWRLGAIAVLGLTAPLPLFAQSSGGSSDSVATANEATSRDPAATDANVTRVPEASMRQHFTSKDLIGAEVYDANGEKIGDIADIGLESPEISELARAFQAGQVAEEGREAESGADTSDTTVVSPASATGAPEPRATDASSSGPRVFISVGGLWGIGDDLVSVPLSDLSYNAAEARFEIPVMKADVVALNEADAEGEGVETDTEEDSVVGKQAFTDDATRVETALRTDERTSAFAQNVSVMLEDGEIRLRGTVADEAQRQLLLAVARDATEMTIQDHLVIRR